MADEKEAGAGEALQRKINISLLLVIANSVAVVVTLAALVYTRILFRRPAITETGERTRLAQTAARPTLAKLPGQVDFKSLTANILHVPDKPEGGPGSPGEGKAHYITVTFSVEIRDATQVEAVERVRPEIEDRLLQLLGKKPFEDLNSVQGRYLLRSEIVEIVNELAGTPLATDVFFTQFIVQ